MIHQNYLNHMKKNFENQIAIIDQRLKAEIERLEHSEISKSIRFVNSIKKSN